MKRPTMPVQLSFDQGLPDPVPLPTRKQKLQQLLADGGWHSWKECQAIGGARFGARLLELKNGGLTIEQEFRGKNNPYYRWPGAVKPAAEGAASDA